MLCWLLLLLLLLSRFSRVRLCATPQTAAHQAPRPWDSPGENTGVGCHFLLQCMTVKSEVAQSCLTLSNPMDCSPPGSPVHGLVQARVLQWGAIAFSMLVSTIQQSDSAVHTSPLFWISFLFQSAQSPEQTSLSTDTIPELLDSILPTAALLSKLEIIPSNPATALSTKFMSHSIDTSLVISIILHTTFIRSRSHFKKPISLLSP